MKCFKASIVVFTLCLYFEITWAQPGFGHGPRGGGHFQQQLHQMQQPGAAGADSSGSSSSGQPTSEELMKLGIAQPPPGLEVSLNQHDQERLDKLRQESGSSSGGNFGGPNFGGPGGGPHGPGMGGGPFGPGGPHGPGGSGGPHGPGGPGGPHGPGGPFGPHGPGGPRGMFPGGPGGPGGMMQGGFGAGGPHESLNPGDSDEIVSAMSEEIKHAPAPMQAELRQDLPKMVHHVEDYLARDAGYSSYSAFISPDHNNNYRSKSPSVLGNIMLLVFLSMTLAFV